MLNDRLALYRRIEKKRGRPLIAYVTSTRVNADGQISGDAVAEIQEQLQALPSGTKELDLLLVSVGGDPTVAWRIVSLIRERCEKFSVLVPHAAFSAATLIVLGADEIVMHPNGNLGPTDPQILVAKSGKPNEATRFGSEDLSAFLKYVKDNVGKDEKVVSESFKKFCEDAGSSIAIGVAARGTQLSLTMAEKLLQLHMKGESKAEAKAIAGKLNKDYAHHGYPVNRTEAKDIGLKVVQADAEVEDLMWKIWTRLHEDLRVREPFNPVGLIKANPACAAIFAPVPSAAIPANLPPEIMQQVVNNLLAQCAVAGVPGTEYETVQAVVESHRLASQHVTRGLIFASRLPDLNFKVSNVIDRQGWATVHPIAKAGPAPVPVE